MYRLFLALAVLVVGLTAISAQETPVDQSAAQKNYSESTPYEPRKFDETVLSKRERKSKLKSDGKVKPVDKETVSNQPATPDANVKIPVFVYDAKGNAVTGLKSSEIKLFFDDREHEIAAIESAAPGLDIVLLVDTSPSTIFAPDDLKNFVTKLTESLKPEDKIQIISFNGELNVLCDSTNDKEVIKKAIKKLKIGEGTSIYETVSKIFQKHLSLESSGKTVILLSDGVDTTSYDADYISSLFAAEKNASVVFPFYLDTFSNAQRVPTIALTGGPLFGNRLPRPSVGSRTRIGISKEEYELGFAYLQDLAKLSGGRSFQIKDMAATKTDELQRLMAVLKPQYFVTFKPLTADDTSGRKLLKLRVNRPNLTILARGSYVR
jgi:VWFA-related protein